MAGEGETVARSAAGAVVLSVVLGVAGCRACNDTAGTASAGAASEGAASSPAPASPPKSAAPYLPVGSGTEAPSVVDWVLSRMRPSLNRCYRSVLRPEHPAPRGEAVFHVEIADDGTVKDVSLLSQHGLGMDLVGCVTTALKTASFPPPPGGAVAVNVPLIFDPPKSTDAGP